MPFSLETQIISVLFALIAWLVIYKLVTAKDKINKVLNTSIIVILLYLFICKFAYYVYGFASKLMFQQHANGQVQLDESPLKIPSNALPGYCNQFTDDKGKPLATITGWSNDRIYCGTFWGLYNEAVVIIPFKFLPDNKIEYWADPDLKIIAPIKDKELFYNK